MTPSQRHSDEPREATIADEVTPELVLAHLATLSQPASIRHIAHGMGLKHRGRRFLPRVLQKLKKHGEVEETQGGKFRLAGTKNAKKEAAGQAAAAKRVHVANAVAASASSEQKTPSAGMVDDGDAADGNARGAASGGKSNNASRGAGAIRIWCRGELWRIATATLFWCRIRRCRASREIYLLGAMGWERRCTATAC